MGLARVTIDAARVRKPLERVWASFGYDELNWTATLRGRANMSALRTIFGEPAVVRAHNLLTSGNGRALPHWSSGNVYHEDDRGRPLYDWSQIDPVFDVWVENDMVPLVELGFCPIQLSRPSTMAFPKMPSSSGEYENWGWASPPKDMLRWESLIEAVVGHLAGRYGAAESVRLVLGAVERTRYRLLAGERGGVLPALRCDCGCRPKIAPSGAGGWTGYNRSRQ